MVAQSINSVQFSYAAMHINTEYIVPITHKSHTCNLLVLSTTHTPTPPPAILNCWLILNLVVSQNLSAIGCLCFGEGVCTLVVSKALASEPSMTTVLACASV